MINTNMDDIEKRIREITGQTQETIESMLQWNRLLSWHRDYLLKNQQEEESSLLVKPDKIWLPEDRRKTQWYIAEEDDD